MFSHISSALTCPDTSSSPSRSLCLGLFQQSRASENQPELRKIHLIGIQKMFQWKDDETVVYTTGIITLLDVVCGWCARGFILDKYFHLVAE